MGVLAVVDMCVLIWGRIWHHAVLGRGWRWLEGRLLLLHGLLHVVGVRLLLLLGHPVGRVGAGLELGRRLLRLTRHRLTHVGLLLLLTTYRRHVGGLRLAGRGDKTRVVGHWVLLLLYIIVVL